MSTIRTQFGPVTNFGITLNGLASGAARSSAKIENQNSRYIDAVCQFKIKTATGTFGDRYAVYFFAWGAADDVSPICPTGVTGVDEAVSVGLETLSIRPIGSLYVAAAGTVISPPFSVAPAFGNVLPPVWGIATGILLLDTTAPNGADKSGVAIVRNAIISDNGITWPAGATQPQKDAAIAQLKNAGILVRQGA